MNWTQWLGRLSLLVGGALVGLVLADCGARAIQPHGAADLLFNAPDNAPQGMYVSDKELVYLPHPGFTGTMKSLGYRVPLSFDRHGLRGPEPGEKTRPRWLFTGDSFTMAAQVTEAQHFARLAGEAVGIEALIGGADGWSTWQASRFYRRLDPELDLDGVVVIFFLGNDHQDNERFRMELDRAQQRQDGTPLGGRHINAYTSFLLKHSYIYGLYVVRHRVAQMQQEGNSERERWKRELSPFTTQGPGQLERTMQHTRKALEELKRGAAEAGDSLIVAVAPPAFVVDQERLEATFELVGLDPARAAPEAPGEALMAMLTSQGIAGCDLVAPLQEAARTSTEPLYYTYDGHWTPAGHAVVAEALAACMESP